jgi:uncharacterized protein (TIGR02145 family)
MCPIILISLMSIVTYSCEKDDDNTVLDIDGNVYYTVTIGKQVWMVENLKTTHYNDGTEIAQGSSIGDYSGEAEPEYWFAYNDNLANVDTFGRLYTWYVVNSFHDICPKGWHIPTDSEWNELQVFLGMIPSDTILICSENNDISGKLKETGLKHWTYPNTCATDEYGFKVLPAGYRRRFYQEFAYKGEYACFWTSTEWDNSNAWYRHFYYNKASICRTYNLKNYGFSIRCIKD